jgi:hypothetical protein
MAAYPLMASTAHESGPGGASPIVGLGGKLYLAYASYSPGEYRAAGIPQPRPTFRRFTSEVIARSLRPRIRV